LRIAVEMELKARQQRPRRRRKSNGPR
jgi:hypothetical protein